MGHMIDVSVDIPASIDEVWQDLARIESHVEWMRDAVEIEFLAGPRRGVGTRIRVPTRIGPLRTVDYITFTAWEAPNRMVVAHEGLFTGCGEFALRSTGTGTELTWREQIQFPAAFGGALGARIGAPILRRVWRANLDRFARRFSLPVSDG
jgi:carbon monoxide dehydrogenase subunit G